jgi:hypothetical protein
MLADEHRPPIPILSSYPHEGTNNMPVSCKIRLILRTQLRNFVMTKLRNYEITS